MTSTQFYFPTQNMQPNVGFGQMQESLNAAQIKQANDLFDTLDKNHDGLISRDELANLYRTRQLAANGAQPLSFTQPMQSQDVNAFTQAQNYMASYPGVEQPAMAYTTLEQAPYMPPAAVPYSPPAMAFSPPHTQVASAQPPAAYNAAQAGTMYSAPPNPTIVAFPQTATGGNAPVNYVSGGQYGQSLSDGNSMFGSTRGGSRGRVCQCGKVMLPDSRFCPSCGQPVTTIPPQGPSAVELFDMIDRDHTGYISRDEFAAAFHNRLEFVRNVQGTSADCLLM